MSLTVRPFQAEKIEPPTGFKDFRWPSTFQDGAPIDVEIGCGVGWHPIQYTKANPDRRLVAIEHTREKFESFQGRVEKHPSLSNLLPIHADATRWITHAFPIDGDLRVDRFFILYPNPEPNSPNKRWHRMPFFRRLIDVLKPGGTIELATNIESYAKEAVEYGRNAWNLEVVENKSFTERAPRTHFEKKYLLRGETCFNVIFRKPRS